MKVQLVAKSTAGTTGTSRYTDNLNRGLQSAGVDVTLTYPQPFPPWPRVRQGLRRAGLDVEAFFGSYPLRVPSSGADVVHLTTQTMGTLLLGQRFDRPVVVTVLDIIPWLVRKNSKLNTLRNPIDALFYRLALLGLRRAHAIIAISHWTKQTLIDELGFLATKIHVVYPIVDEERFKCELVPDSFFKRYQLSGKYNYILYVGSDDPRKNLKTLVEALALVKARIVNTKLLMVGPRQFGHERTEIVKLVSRLGLSPHVAYFSGVNDADLVMFYNAADVCVMPSKFEGYGLPVMEALRCGTPVIVADAASLPEIVGSAGVVVSPADIKGWCTAIVDILEKGPSSRSRHLDPVYPRNSFPASIQTVQSNTMIDIYRRLATGV